jgi:hypothetical protein
MSAASEAELNAKEPSSQEQRALAGSAGILPGLQRAKHV